MLFRGATPPTAAGRLPVLAGFVQRDGQHGEDGEVGVEADAPDAACAQRCEGVVVLESSVDALDARPLSRILFQRRDPIPRCTPSAAHPLS